MRNLSNFGKEDDPSIQFLYENTSTIGASLGGKIDGLQLGKKMIEDYTNEELYMVKHALLNIKDCLNKTDDISLKNSIVYNVNQILELLDDE